MQQDWELDDHKKLKKCSKTEPKNLQGICDAMIRG